MYLDPSFGGMLLQIIVAIIAGGGAILFGMRRKFKLMTKKDRNKPSNIANQNNSEVEDVIDMLDDKNK